MLTEVEVKKVYKYKRSVDKLTKDDAYKEIKLVAGWQSDFALRLRCEVAELEMQDGN